MSSKNNKNFDGLDLSKISQGDLIGRPDAEVELGRVEHSSRFFPGHNLDIDVDDSEGLLPENFSEIFQAAIKNIIKVEDLKAGGDIFLDLPLRPQKAEKGGFIPLEYQRFIFCSQCQAAAVRGCLKCGGTGRVMAHRRVEIKIPKNSLGDSVLQITNEGHAPEIGSGQTKSGDLFVKLVIREE